MCAGFAAVAAFGPYVSHRAAVFGALYTLAKTEIIYPKNVRAKVAMDFT